MLKHVSHRSTASLGGIQHGDRRASAPTRPFDRRTSEGVIVSSCRSRRNTSHAALLGEVASSPCSRTTTPEVNRRFQGGGPCSLELSIQDSVCATPVTPRTIGSAVSFPNSGRLGGSNPGTPFQIRTGGSPQSSPTFSKTGESVLGTTLRSRSSFSMSVSPLPERNVFDTPPVTLHDKPIRISHSYGADTSPGLLGRCMSTPAGCRFSLSAPSCEFQPKRSSCQESYSNLTSSQLVEENSEAFHLSSNSEPPCEVHRSCTLPRRSILAFWTPPLQSAVSYSSFPPGGNCPLTGRSSSTSSLSDTIVGSPTTGSSKVPVRIHLRQLRPDIEYKTLRLDEQTSCRQLIEHLLQKLRLKHRDPNLFAVVLEVAVKGTAGAPPLKKRFLLDDSARPVELQQCRPRGEANFSITMRRGGVLRVRDSVLAPGSQYKSLLVSFTSSATDVIALLLRCNNSTDSPDTFALHHVTSTPFYDRPLNSHEKPLQIQALWTKEQYLNHQFVLRRRPNQVAADKASMWSQTLRSRTASVDARMVSQHVISEVRTTSNNKLNNVLRTPNINVNLMSTTVSSNRSSISSTCSTSSSSSNPGTIFNKNIINSPYTHKLCDSGFSSVASSPQPVTPPLRTIPPPLRTILKPNYAPKQNSTSNCEHLKGRSSTAENFEEIFVQTQDAVDKSQFPHKSCTKSGDQLGISMISKDNGRVEGETEIINPASRETDKKNTSRSNLQFEGRLNSETNENAIHSIHDDVSQNKRLNTLNHESYHSSPIISLQKDSSKFSNFALSCLELTESQQHNQNIPNGNLTCSSENCSSAVISSSFSKSNRLASRPSQLSSSKSTPCIKPALVVFDSPSASSQYCNSSETSPSLQVPYTMLAEREPAEEHQVNKFEDRTPVNANLKDFDPSVKNDSANRIENTVSNSSSLVKTAVTNRKFCERPNTPPAVPPRPNQTRIRPLRLLDVPLTTSTNCEHQIELSSLTTSAQLCTLNKVGTSVTTYTAGKCDSDSSCPPPLPHSSPPPLTPKDAKSDSVHFSYNEPQSKKSSPFPIRRSSFPSALTLLNSEFEKVDTASASRVDFHDRRKSEVLSESSKMFKVDLSSDHESISREHAEKTEVELQEAINSLKYLSAHDNYKDLIYV